MKYLTFLKLELTDFWDVFYLVIGFLLGASAVIGAVTVIWTKVARPFYINWIKPIQEANIHRSAIQESIVKMQTDVESIAAELKTNGGESLRDAICRIETKVDYGNSKLRFRDQLSVNAVFEMDAHGNCIFANRALCNLLDIDESEFLDRRWLAKIANQDDKSHLLQQWIDAAFNKIPLNLEYKFQIEGQIKVASIRAEPALDRKNELVGFMCLLDLQNS